MKQAIVIAAALGALSFASCKGMTGADDVEMEVTSTATVLAVTGMT